MAIATAISIPTAPVVPAIRHIFLESGSMSGRCANTSTPTNQDWRLAPSELGEDLLGRDHEGLHVLGGVGEGDERRLELGGGQVEPAIQHGVKEPAIAGHVRLLGAGQILDLD